MKKLLLLLIFATSSIFGQAVMQYPKDDTTSVKKDYPYILPIWGQKLTDRNIEFPLPFGLNVNYVFNDMALDLTHFEMTNREGTPIIPDYLNTDSLNFQHVSGSTQGINIRADVWVFPFLNFYGLYSESKGQTKVALAPTFLDELYIDVPPADFDATTWGFGTTIVYGWDNYFINLDGNFSKSKSQLLDQSVGFFVGSARIGRRVQFNNGMKLSVYIGAMYRNFVNHEKSNGSINFSELAPGFREGLLGGIEDKYNSNKDEIDYLQNNQPPGWQVKVAALEKKNEKLYDIYGNISNKPPAQINYSIKKEITKLWSTQVGFNWEISRNWQYRGELGYSYGQRFFMTGLQYRFGL